MTTPAWHRATLAAALLATDPTGLGGLWLRARSGPVRDRFCDLLTGLLAETPLPARRLHPTIDDDQLYGGIDLAATLDNGYLVENKGVLTTPAILWLTMAERAPAGLAARLGAALDQSQTQTLIALDEGAGPDEALAPALADRLALHLDLSQMGWGATDDTTPDPRTLRDARALLSRVTLPASAVTDLAVLAARLGVDSLRAPSLALRVARAHAALMGRAEADFDDITAAAELVLAPRATQLPGAPEDAADPPAPPPDTQADAPGDTDELQTALPDEVLLDAVRAILPADILDQLAAMRAARVAGAAGGSGDAKAGNRRGRPLPARPGRLGTGARLDLVATLRAAAPWQKLRAARAAESGLSRPGQLHVRASDIRIRRFEERSDRLLIFAVDASGSAALARLAEAKGAVELLLAQAYARRDHVALVAFRGAGADVLLPPTRSLVQTKRRLAALPGGGGTPLAAGLRSALEISVTARARGLTPSIALLTDGRANIALDGRADRVAAAEDATQIARALRAQSTPSLVIDTARRPQDALRALSDAMGAPYLPLPRADAQGLSQAVSAALGG